MKKISLCMIVKNEEKILERCLKSAYSIADEIIIVDTGSVDKTVDIAKKYTNNVYNFEWVDDFSKARNFAISKATCEYIMWLDADDVIPTKSAKKILQLKSNLTADTYMLKYNLMSENNIMLSFYRERIIRRCKQCYFQGCVHECIAPFGKVERLDIAIEHRKIDFTNSDRNIKIYENILITRDLSPREQYYYGRELYDHKRYKKCISVLCKFVKNGLGWEENTIEACAIIAECYTLLHDDNSAIKYLIESLKYDAPRANIACLIGDYFLRNNKFNSAIHWYNTATKCSKDIIGFVPNMYYNYYPYLQLCVCYYKLGNIEKSEEYNKKAHRISPSETTKKNKLFFEQLKK